MMKQRAIPSSFRRVILLVSVSVAVSICVEAPSYNWRQWMGSPDLTALGIWLLPVCVLWRRHTPADRVSPLAALFLAISGVIAGSDFLICASLAFTIGSCVSFGPSKIYWLAASVAWMPSFTQVEPGLSADALSFARVGLALLGNIGVASALLCGHFAASEAEKMVW